MVLIEPRLVKDAPQLLAGGLAVGDHAVPKMLLGALSEVASFKDAFQVLVSAASFKCGSYKDAFQFLVRAFML